MNDAAGTAASTTASDDAGAGGAPVPPRTGTRIRQGLQAAGGVAVAAVLVGWGLPYLTHTSWSTILGLVTGVGWATFAALLALMLLGLYCYTFTLAASLPGLTHTQALIVNLAGSGVSNVLPAGGAVGTALTYAMYRSWRFDHRSISTSIVVTTVWNLLARLALPVVAALALVPASTKVPSAMLMSALTGGAVGALIAGVLVIVIASPAAAAATGRAVDATLGPLVRRWRGGSTLDAHHLALGLRAQVVGVVAARWVPLTAGLAGFMGAYFLLFWACADAVGVELSGAEIFAAYAVGRLLTAVAVTPGGIGVSEAGAAAVLLALGVPGGPSAACVTLFALFSFVLEIPFGAVAVLAWTQTRGHYHRRGHLRGPAADDSSGAR